MVPGLALPPKACGSAMTSVHPASTVEEFQAKAGSWLNQKETQNNLILGITSNIASKPISERQEHYFWTVEKDGEVVGAAFWTPPYKFTITEMEKDSLTVLANTIRDSHPHIPGVGGPKETAKHFSHLWNLKTHKSPLLETSMRLYHLEKVQETPVNTGVFQCAQEKERELLTEWLGKFYREVDLSEEVDEKTMVENYLREQRLFIWEDNGHRAMAGYSGSTANGVRVNMVYTPPEFRQKGYATSLVTALSRRLLDSGKKFCCLYTDLLNPTSNSIYQKIGYQPVCDWNAYKFK